MSTDVNVYVYSTSNLLFLAGSAQQLRLIPKQMIKSDGEEILDAGHRMQIFQFENEP